MKLYEEINKHPTRGDQVKVGLTILIGLSIIGTAQLLLRHRVLLAESLWAVGISACVVGFIPRLGRLLYIGWMGLGVTIGLVTQPLVMAAAYALLFVPIGLIFRAIGRDLMQRKLARGTASYWEDYDESEDPVAYFRQY